MDILPSGQTRRTMYYAYSADTLFITAASGDTTLEDADGPPIDVQVCKCDDADNANEAEITAILLAKLRARRNRAPRYA